MFDSFCDPWTVAHQAPLSVGFPWKNTGVRCHFLLNGILQTQGSNPSPVFPALQADSLPLSHAGSPSGTLFSTKTSEVTHHVKVWRKLKFPKLEANLLMATFYMIPTIQDFGKFKTMERVKRSVGLPRC